MSKITIYTKSYEELDKLSQFKLDLKITTRLYIYLRDLLYEKLGHLRYKTYTHSDLKERSFIRQIVDSWRRDRKENMKHYSTDIFFIRPLFESLCKNNNDDTCIQYFKKFTEHTAEFNEETILDDFAKKILQEMDDFAKKYNKMAIKSKFYDKIKGLLSDPSISEKLEKIKEGDLDKLLKKFIRDISNNGTSISNDNSAETKSVGTSPDATVGTSVGRQSFTSGEISQTASPLTNNNGANPENLDLDKEQIYLPGSLGETRTVPMADVVDKDGAASSTVIGESLGAHKTTDSIGASTPTAMQYRASPVPPPPSPDTAARRVTAAVRRHAAREGELAPRSLFDSQTPRSGGKTIKSVLNKSLKKLRPRKKFSQKRR